MGQGYITYVEDWGNNEYLVDGLVVRGYKGFKYKQLEGFSGTPEDYEMVYREDFLETDFDARFSLLSEEIRLDINNYSSNGKIFDVIEDQKLRERCVGRLSTLDESEQDQSYVVRMIVIVIDRGNQWEAKIKVVKVNGFSGVTKELDEKELSGLVEDISQDVIQDLLSLRYVMKDLRTRTGYQLNLDDRK